MPSKNNKKKKKKTNTTGKQDDEFDFSDLEEETKQKLNVKEESKKQQYQSQYDVMKIKPIGKVSN